jgi:hypothetical protein
VQSGCVQGGVRDDSGAAAGFEEEGRGEEEGGEGGGFGGGDSEFAEEAVLFGVGTGSEVKGVGIAEADAVAEGEAPEAVDGDDVAIGIAEVVDEVTGGGVEGGDGAVAEVGDEEVAAELAGGGGDGHFPGGVEVAAVVEFTYKGTAFTGDQAAIAQGDNFLSIIVPEIMATQAYQNNGAIVIWDDESEGGDSGNFAIPEIVISPLAKGNAFARNVEMNHSSDIKTMEEIFGLGGTLNNTLPANEPYGGTAGLNAVSTANDLSSLFVAGAIPSAVPEPSSIGLLGVAGVALIARRRKNA